MNFGPLNPLGTITTSGALGAKPYFGRSPNTTVPNSEDPLKNNFFLCLMK